MEWWCVLGAQKLYTTKQMNLRPSLKHTCAIYYLIPNFTVHKNLRWAFTYTFKFGGKNSTVNPIDAIKMTT